MMIRNRDYLFQVGHVVILIRSDHPTVRGHYSLATGPRRSRVRKPLCNCRLQLDEGLGNLGT